MRGSTLKAILDQQGVSVSELARRLSISPQTLYSMVKRDSQKVDFDLMLRICKELQVPVEQFSDAEGLPDMPDSGELELIRRYRLLDDCGQELTQMVVNSQLKRLEAARVPEEAAEPQKIIPLYATPAAAGYASPAFGDDYTNYPVAAGSGADFAVRIEGDSMEPYLENGSVALCRREIIHDGDVGLFFVDGDMKCKQYCRDFAGNVYLFSLNRQRADADMTIPASSGITICCFGKVLMKKRVPLPT